MKGLTTKHIFKRAIADIVPAEILNRPKQGFGVPIQQWINNELRERICDTLLETRTGQRGYVEPRYIRLLIEEHRRGRRDHSGQLWALYMLELWQRRYCDERLAPTEPQHPLAPKDRIQHNRPWHEVERTLKTNILQLIGNFHQGGSERQAVQLSRAMHVGRVQSPRGMPEFQWHSSQ